MSDFTDMIDDDYHEGNETDESMELILPALTQELIDKLKMVYPDSVKCCNDNNDLQFYKGVQSIIEFIEEQYNKQIDRGE